LRQPQSEWAPPTATQAPADRESAERVDPVITTVRDVSIEPMVLSIAHFHSAHMHFVR